MKKPTIGSVTAPQALPMNSTMEAWKAVICRAKQGQIGVKNTCGHKTTISIYSYMGATHTLSHTLSLSLNTLPGQHRAGRFAGRRLWRWQPPPWVRRQWRNTTYCIMATSGSSRSVKECWQGGGQLNKIMVVLMNTLSFLHCKHSYEDSYSRWEQEMCEIKDANHWKMIADTKHRLLTAYCWSIN